MIRCHTNPHKQVMEGALSRSGIAKRARVDLQTLCDWVHRYNVEGPGGLKDRVPADVQRNWMRSREPRSKDGLKKIRSRVSRPGPRDGSRPKLNRAFGSCCHRRAFATWFGPRASASRRHSLNDSIDSIPIMEYMIR